MHCRSFYSQAATPTFLISATYQSRRIQIAKHHLQPDNHCKRQKKRLDDLQPHQLIHILLTLNAG